MSDVKHTSGPWSWVVHDYSMASLAGHNSVGEHDGIEGVVMSVSPCRSCAERAKGEWKWGRCSTPNSADARLIAAAPDMLAALKAVVSVADRATDEFDLARAAIAKAEAA